VDSLYLMGASDTSRRVASMLSNCFLAISAVVLLIKAQQSIDSLSE